MSVEKTTEHWILESIQEHQRDLHLLFVHDVEIMDVPLYNAIMLILNNAEIKIKEAIINHKIRMEG